jgi:hypothetical protein
MKVFYPAIGLAGVILAGAANATPGPGVLPGNALYSSFVTNVYDNNSVALHAPLAGTQGGNPDSQQFFAPTATTISDITFRLAGGSAPAGGSLLVYLVQDGGNNLPSLSGLSLTNNTLLGSIAESSLTTLASNVLFTPTVGTGVISAPGDYWIALVNSATSDTVVWERAGDLIGLDVGNNASNTNDGLYNSHVQNSGSTLSMTSVNTNAFELQINVADPVSAPEPASLAVLGLAMVGLGAARHRHIRRA